MATRHPELLYIALDHLVRGHPAAAAAAIGEVLEHARADPDPLATRHVTFAHALAARLPSDSGRRLGQPRRHDDDSERLFDALASRLPTHSLASALSNAYILSACDARRRVHLIDIGIGTGRQVVDLIGALSAREREVDDLVIVGVEPHGPSLQAARAHAHEAAERVGIPCQFHAIQAPIERVTPAQWGALSALLERPIVNACFSLHRVSGHPEYDARDHVLARVRALEPGVVVVAEHHVDHATSDLRARFEHCWRHYGALLDLLALLDLTREERDAIEIHHFGRAIHDIIGRPDPERSMRHEPTWSWARRLARAGFTAARFAPALPRHALLDVRLHADHLALDHRGETLVSLLAWEPSVSSPSHLPSHRPDT